MRVEVDRELTGVLRLGVLRLCAISLPPDGGDALWARVEAGCAELAARFAGLTAGQIPQTRETRRLYKAVGLDPTKTRPSSEALLRRILQGKPLHRVHPLVDLFNLASVDAQLSVGLYDESRIAGDTVTARLGREGWSFEGIRRGEINVAGRLCVVDAEGPFGSPTADSMRTSIDGPVQEALAIFFQPANGDPERLAGAIDAAWAMARDHLSAAVASREIVE